MACCCCWHFMHLYQPWITLFPKERAVIYNSFQLLMPLKVALLVAMNRVECLDQPPPHPHPHLYLGISYQSFATSGPLGIPCELVRSSKKGNFLAPWRWQHLDSVPPLIGHDSFSLLDLFVRRKRERGEVMMRQGAGQWVERTF